MREPGPISDTELAAIEALARERAITMPYTTDPWGIVLSLLAEVRRLRGLLADVAIPVEGFYGAMADSNLLAPEVRTELEAAVQALRAELGIQPPGAAGAGR